MFQNWKSDRKSLQAEGNDYSNGVQEVRGCLLYTSDAADDGGRVDLGGRRIIKKKKNNNLGL